MDDKPEESENQEFYDEWADESSPSESDTPHALERRQQHRVGLSQADRRSTHLWLISYSDFMTILMIFFLAMYGYAYMAKAALFQMQEKYISYSEFSKQMAELNVGLDKQIDVREDDKKIVFELPDRILFQSGQAKLTPTAMRAIDDLANSIKLVLGDVVVQGHTDNVPIAHGPYRSNWELSAARAFSVIEALTQAGVPAHRLSAWGFGEHRPLGNNRTSGGKMKNRRIEIVLLKKDEKGE